MKPVLVVEMGNPLMGDDGVGAHVARRLAADPRPPDTVDVIEGGTDLLRIGAQIEGREQVLIVDAAQDDDPPGIVHIFEDNLPSDSARRYSHDLSVVDAIQLLRRFQHVRIVLMTVSVASAEAGDGLSAAVRSSLTPIVDRAIEEARRLSAVPEVRPCSGRP